MAVAALKTAPGGGKLVGVRHQLQVEPDPRYLARPGVREGLIVVAAAGLAYDVVVSPGQLPLVAETAVALPHVRFVLDHAGKPPIASGDQQAWRADLARLGALPNMAVKLSGLVTEADWAGRAQADLALSSTTCWPASAPNAPWSAPTGRSACWPPITARCGQPSLGAPLAGRPRDHYVLSTKVGRLLEPNPAPTGSDLRTGGFAVPDDLRRRFDFSRDGVLRSLESSLDRLAVSQVDIVYVHDPDEHVDQAIAEAIPALTELRDQGVVGAVGAGMNQWQALQRIVRQTDLDVVMLAGRWTLLDRSGAPLLAACAERGVAVVAAAPYNSGLLAQDWPQPDTHFDYGQPSGEILAQARALAGSCQRHGTRVPAAALQFPMRHPAVTSVVAGMRTAAEVRTAVRYLAEPVPDAAWTELEASARRGETAHAGEDPYTDRRRRA